VIMVSAECYLVMELHLHNVLCKPDGWFFSFPSTCHGPKQKIEY
jgi:hypothetical protein